jgi:hypothetical protein
LEKYSHLHEHLDVKKVHALIEHWLAELEVTQFAVNPLNAKNAPHLALEAA